MDVPAAVTEIRALLADARDGTGYASTDNFARIEELLTVIETESHRA